MLLINNGFISDTNKHQAISIQAIMNGRFAYRLVPIRVLGLKFEFRTMKAVRNIARQVNLIQTMQMLLLNDRCKKRACLIHITKN